MKENGTQIILEDSIKNYDIHLKDNKNITENNINNQQNKENFEEDLVNIMKLIDKNDMERFQKIWNRLLSFRRK